MDDLDDDEEAWEHIIAFIRDFARSDFGQQTLVEIEEFGLPGVDSAADLTAVQSAFFRLARNERNERQNRQSR